MTRIVPTEPAPLHTNIHTNDAGTVIDVTGEIDMQTAPQLYTVITEVMTTHPSVLIIDLTAVTFIASAGLSILVEADRNADRTNVRVVVNDITSRTLQLTGLNDVLSIFSTVAEASGEATTNH